jgi:hypothetical protein
MAMDHVERWLEVRELRAIVRVGETVVATEQARMPGGVEEAKLSVSSLCGGGVFSEAPGIQRKRPRYAASCSCPWCGVRVEEEEE